VIETEGDARGAEVKVAGNMEVFLCLEIASDSVFGLQRPQDSVVRRRKHNDDALWSFSFSFSFSLYMFIWFGI
jgi:hypothetical protein